VGADAKFSRGFGVRVSKPLICRNDARLFEALAE